MSINTLHKGDDDDDDNNNNGVKICVLKVVRDCVFLRIKRDGVITTYIVVVCDGYITDSNVINVNPKQYSFL